MAIQIQTRRLGRGFDVKWEVYGEWRGSKLPKYAQKYVSEFIKDREYDVRVIKSGEAEFIK